MPQALVIDGFAFARGGKSVAGVLRLADMARIAESGCSRADVSYTVRGGMNSRGKPSLAIQASGEVELVCQRCLEPVAVPLEVNSDLELCSDEVEIATAEDDVDRVLAGEAMDVVSLVEDEVLLALPMAAKHEICKPAGGGADGVQRSAFAVLAGLKKDH